MSFASTPLGQGRRLDHRTFLNKKKPVSTSSSSTTGSSSQIQPLARPYRQQAHPPASYAYGAPTLASRSPPKPERSAAVASHPEEEIVSDSEQPALVRFARLKQREQGQQDQQEQTRAVGTRVINTPPNPDRWSVKDTSVNIAGAFHRAAGNIIPAYDTSASGSSSQNTTFNTSAGTMNPNDSWAAGLQPRPTVPRSTSVEYEKETHSIVTRRLAGPPSRGNGIPQPKPLARTHSVHNIGDSEGEEVEGVREIVPNGRVKTITEHVMDATRRLAPATFFMRRQSEEPEPRSDVGQGSTQDKSSSYEYSAEEREFQAASLQEQAVPARRNAAAHRRNRISVDNKAYKPSVSDLEESDSDYGSDDGKRTKKRRGKKVGAAGGPLTSLPVTSYDKRKRRRKSGAKETEQDEAGSEEEELQEKSTQHNVIPSRAPSVLRSSVPPPSRRSLPSESLHDTSGLNSYLDVESGLHSIQEVEEALEPDDSVIEQVSHSSFSVGALLGRGVYILFKTFWWIMNSIWAAVSFLPWMFGRALGYTLHLLLRPVRRLSRTDPAPFLRLGKYAAIASSIYLAWYALNSGLLDHLAPRPVFRPPYQAPDAIPSDLADLASRLLKLENTLTRISVDTERSRTYIEGDARSQAALSGRLGALESRLQTESARIYDTESKIKASTSQELLSVKREIEHLHAQLLEAQRESEKHYVPDAASDEQARVKLRDLEERMGSVEGEVKDALELSKSAVKAGGAAGAVAAWWNKLATDETASVTIKSADGQDVTSLITHLVDSAVSKASKDVLALPDFALYSGGAAVIAALTSETFEIRPHGFTSQVLGMVTGNGYAIGRPPVTALHHDIHTGHCWPFPGSQGHLGIKLSSPIYISAVTIDHVAAAVALDLRSAPRQMELWGLVEGAENKEKIEEWRANRRFYDESGIEYTKMLNPEHFVQLTTFTYNVHEPEHIQTFAIPKEIQDLGVDFGVVVLAVKSNWGREELTCLYRVRVHGEPLGGYPSPLPESDLNRHNMPSNPR